MNHHQAAPTSPRKSHYYALVALGLTAFALCLIPALRWLPEWNTGDIATREQIQQRVREIAAAGEIVLSEEPLQLSLRTKSDERRLAHHFLRGETSNWLRRERHPFVIQAQAMASWRDSAPANFVLGLGLDARPWHATWIPADFESVFSMAVFPGRAERVPDLASLLLQPGEQLGEAVPILAKNSPVVIYPILGSPSPQTLFVLDQGSVRDANRGPGTLEQAKQYELSRKFGTALLKRIPAILLFLLVLGLLIRLGLTQRIDFKNAAVLTAPILVAVMARSLMYRVEGWIFTIELLVQSLSWPLAFFLLWSVAESWHRTSQPGILNNLDWLRRARVGPQAGRAILGGFALGSLLAGLMLALPAMATGLTWSWGAQSTIQLPAGLLPADGLLIGGFNAGKVLLLLALCLRTLPGKWAPAVAIALSAVVIDGPFAFSWLSLGGNLVFATVLVLAHQRWNITGLLTASLVGSTLPIATFAALHVDWMSGTLATSLILFTVLLVAGFVGLAQPRDQEYQNSIEPVFVRRIEKQRRLRYEMGLLARMQRGLLPTSLPNVDGYQIAARSLLATEVGGDLYHFHHQPGELLWVAAGDVAGHGYSCAIAQAMTKAGLVSLLDSHTSPAEVLHRLDRVLRAGSVERHFTSLVLVRLDLPTGRALISNAGHPYPFLVTQHGHREIAMPSLPLGQGPERTYSDHELHLQEGDALVLYSDGLYEATSPSGQPYGFTRPLETLGRQRIATAGEMLEGLFTDWRYHLAGAAADDDTTLVVLKRSAM